MVLKLMFLSVFAVHSWHTSCETSGGTTSCGVGMQRSQTSAGCRLWTMRTVQTGFKPLVVEPTPLKNIRQNGFIFPEFRGPNSKNYLRCHHLECYGWKGGIYACGKEVPLPDLQALEKVVELCWFLQTHWFDEFGKEKTQKKREIHFGSQCKLPCFANKRRDGSYKFPKNSWCLQVTFSATWITTPW